jgi:hypothetical protein
MIMHNKIADIITQAMDGFFLFNEATGKAFCKRKTD